MKRQRLLLHTCCATCLLYPYELLKDDYDITVYFYNPNIHPLSEFAKRLSGLEKVCYLKKIRLIKGPYDVKKWFDLTKDNKGDPEGGRRCEICFEMRLEKSARKAKELGITYFTTTLTVSPHKKSNTINKIGKRNQTGINYLKSDFKKKDGFKKTMDLSKQMDIYRQDYCGCIYSIRS